jgi:hypothetical protein
MERAQTDPVTAHSLERDVLLDHIGDGHRGAETLQILVDNRHASEATPR